MVKKPLVALALSIIPGFGHVYNDKNRRGIEFFLSWFVLFIFMGIMMRFQYGVIGFMFMVVWLIIWIWSGYDAYKIAKGWG